MGQRLCLGLANPLSTYPQRWGEAVKESGCPIEKE
jgi:hypothetical protein